MAANQNYEESSVHSSTTNTALSENSASAMKDITDDPEKGVDDAENSNTEESQNTSTEGAPQKPESPAAGPPGLGPPPDGGLQAWLTVLAGFCGLFVSFGWINCR